MSVPMPKRALRPSSDRILGAAEQVFATHNYGDVSLRQLIAAAGVSTTAFYARFDSKAAVLDTLAERLFAELHAEARTALRGTRDLEDGIARGIALVCAKFGPRKPLVRMILSEIGPHQVRRRSYALLAAFLAHRLKAFADPEALAWAIIGALEIQITRWAVWDELDLPALRAQLVATAHAILPASRVRA
jgi:AcrR family transcriptional regulator